MNFDEIITKIRQSIFLDDEQKSFLLGNFVDMSDEVKIKYVSLIEKMDKAQNLVLGQFLLSNPDFLSEASIFAQKLKRTDLIERETVDRNEEEKILFSIESEIASMFNADET